MTAEVEAEHAHRPAQERPVPHEIGHARARVAMKDDHCLVRVRSPVVVACLGYRREPARAEPDAIARPEADHLPAAGVQGGPEARLAPSPPRAADDATRRPPPGSS